MEYSQIGYSPIPGAERLDSEVEQLTHEAQRTLYRDGGGLSTLQNQTEGSCGCSRGSIAGKLPGSPVHSVRQALQVCLLRERHCWAISRIVHQLARHNPLIHRHPWLFPNRFGKLKVQSRRNSRETGIIGMWPKLPEAKNLITGLAPHPALSRVLGQSFQLS